MVWNLSDQGSFRSGTRLVRGGFERTSSAQWSSSAYSSDQRSLWSGTVWSEVPIVWDGLIRGDFERDLNLGILKEKIELLHFSSYTSHIAKQYQHLSGICVPISPDIGFTAILDLDQNNLIRERSSQGLISEKPCAKKCLLSWTLAEVLPSCTNANLSISNFLHLETRIYDFFGA